MRAWATETALGWEDDKPVPDGMRSMAQRIGFTFDAFQPPSAEAKRLLAHLAEDASRHIPWGGDDGVCISGHGLAMTLLDTPVLLVAGALAALVVIGFVVRTWWRGVKLTLFLLLIAAAGIAVMLYLSRHG